MPDSRRCIAIVDDDPGVLRALARLTEAHAFDAHTYASADDFLRSLSHGAPDCLVLDLQMPDMTGLDLQQELVRHGHKIPTIVITAQNDPHLRQRCQSAGAIAFMLKPLDHHVLISLLIEATGAAGAPPL